MKHRYTYEGARVTGSPPEIELHACNTAKDFERASAGIVECRGRMKDPLSDRVYPVLEQGREETISVGNDMLPMPIGTVYDYEGRMRFFLSCSPAYDERDCGDLWR